MITLDPNHLEFQRAERPERRKIAKEEKKVSNPEPTSMVVSWVGRYKARANLVVVSWTLSVQRTPRRVVIEGGRLQARVNLNGGELDKKPFLRDESSEQLRKREDER